MTSRISYNIHAQGLKDTNRLISHLKIIKPRAVVVMDGLALARVIRANCPETMVIHREWPDDDIYARVSPAQWLSQKRSQVGTDDIWLYTTNEPGYDEKIIAWHEELIKQNFASSNPLKLVVMNISSGVPKPEEWGKADNLLRLISKYRDRVVLGLHEYFGGLPTSGFVGGNPDDIRYHPNYIVRSNWPKGQAAKDITKFHCGRYKFLVDYCTKNNIAIPRIVLTEHGPDAMGDVDPWLKSLKMTSPYNSIRGYKTLATQWKAWYPDWTFAQAYFEILKYLSENIYQDSPVEAQMIFCYGHTAGGQWEQFDVEGDTDFLNLIEKYETTVVQPTPSNPIPVENVPMPTLPDFPSDFDARSIPVTFNSKSGSSINVRNKPGTTGTVVATITTPVNGTCINAENLKTVENITEIINGTNGTWIPIKLTGVQGWVFNALVNTTIIKPDPIPVPPTPIPVPTPTPVNIEEYLKSIETTLDTLQTAMTAMQTQITAAQTQLNTIRQSVTTIREKTKK